MFLNNQSFFPFFTRFLDDSYSGELDKSGNHESTDLNGNPIEGLQYGSKAARSKGGRLENEHSRIPSTLSQIEGYQLGKTQIRDMDSTTTNDAKNEYEKKKIRQQRKKDKKNEQIKVAKDLPGNVGTQNMDKLLEFIGEKPKANGPNNLGTSGKVKSKKHKEKKGVELVGGGGSDNGDDATESKGSSEASEGKHKDTISECSSSGSGTNNSDNMKDNLSDKPASIGDGNRSDVISEVLDSTNIDTPSYYIFTDIEPVPKVEEAFQKVDRKKKKHVTPHNNHTHNHHLSSYPSSHRTHPHQRDNFQHRDQIREKERNSTIPNPHVESEPPKRPTLAVRSITPPPSVEGQKERALSPSAFPALGGGRRNSTGTVTALEVQAPPSDSDVESVRSLPLPSDSIPPVISYAKIAASPKPKDKGPSAAMVKIIAQGTGNTERRHSVGSLNDSINSCKQQEGDSNEKKYSSQELPTTEIEAAARDSVRRKLTDMDNMAAPSVAPSIAKSMDIVSKPDFPTLSEVTQYRGPTSPPIGGSNVDLSNENTSKTPHISKSKSDDLVVAHSSASHSDIKDLEGKKTAEESNTSLTSSKSFTLGIKQKPKQSVVFLGNDKLTSPLNLGISFGFDDKELEALTLDSHQAPQENFTIESDIGNKDSGISFGGDQCIDVDNVATAYEALKMNGIVAPPRELSLCEKISQRTLPQMTSSERQVYYEKQRGNFNLEEMVKYLVKEWERTVELKEKSPNQVLAYTAA
ncbi:unnamed protein product [Owenia fusiformis]|uniref:Uncharacterized protein n=1 Tax=Owenia fusiformis TaxID=6347 RepID=A0A8J1TN39_OWEFU|nr:unnamed protein product [Owenia fusiformis]